MFGAVACHQQEEAAKTKHARMSAIGRRVGLADGSIFGNAALISLANAIEFDLVIARRGMVSAKGETLRKNGVKQRIVEV